MIRVLLAGALVALPAAAPAMTVAEFMTTAEKLRGKGMGAMFSPDLKRIITVMRPIGPAYRADARAARAAGRTDLGCPPAEGKLGITSKEVMAGFAAVPPAQRQTTTVRDAFYALMKKRFPCT